MKLNRLEAHDRLKYLKEDQSQNIFKGAEDCLKNNSLSLAYQEKSPYIYIFAHPRTADNGVDKIMYWQPRLSIPKSQTNSYLFRAISNSDSLEVCWLIPPKEHWDQYKIGNVTESNLCLWSINQFKNNRNNLEKPHPDDMSENQARQILRLIISEKIQQKNLDKIKPKILGDFSICPSSE